MPEQSTAPSVTERTGRGVLDLAIRCGEVIFASGASAEDATATMLAVTRAYGLKGCEADVTHTVITLTWDDPASNDTITRSRNVKYRTLDYTRLTNTSTLIGELLHDPLPLVEARLRVNSIITARPIYPWPVRRVGWSLVGAGAAFLLGGGPLVVVAAFAATFFVDLLTSKLAKTRMSVFYQNLAGGAVGPLVAAVVHYIDPTANSSLVVVATIIMLLAGVTSFGAVQDVLTGFYVTGTARVLEALLITGGLVAGVAGTTMLLARFGLVLDIAPYMAPTFSDLPLLLVAAVVTILGFALAVEVPPRAIWAVSVLGIAAYLVYTGGIAAQFGVGWSAASAAVVVGVLSAVASRIVRTPPLPLVVSALVPLVPGLILFRGLLELSAGSIDGVLSMLEAAAVAVALAAGALLGQYLVQNALGPARRIQRRFVGPLMGVQVRLGRKRDEKI
ncbi:MAG: threonine/serine exporter family protein [Mycetocola sp.]